MPMPTVRFRIDFHRDEGIGPGKIALLEAIAKSGSLSQAARDLGMSYRRAWQLLNSTNASFVDKVAVTSKGGRGGGGASITAFGHALIGSYRAFEKDVQARAARHFQPIVSRARNTQARTKRSPVLRLSDR
jgi:molybdate transport system regulatory protein